MPKKMVGRKMVEVEAPKIVNQTIELEIAFYQFEDPSQVPIGANVVLRCEVERMAICSFATMLLERIEFGETSDKNVYHLARPHLILSKEGVALPKVERLTILGFPRFAESFVGYKASFDRLHVTSRSE